MITNDNMNISVKESLKLNGDNISLYALKRIEELEHTNQQCEEKDREIERLNNDSIKYLNNTWKESMYLLQSKADKLAEALEEIIDNAYTSHVGDIARKAIQNYKG